MLSDNPRKAIRQLSDKINRLESLVLQLQKDIKTMAAEPDTVRIPRPDPEPMTGRYINDTQPIEPKG